MKNLTIETIAVSMVVMSLAAPIRAEMATEEEALKVAKNWTSLIVRNKGEWAGSTAPKVEDIQEFKRGERVIGYLCHVKPEGFIAISLHKELAPVKAYSTVCDLDGESYESDVIKVGMERVLIAIEKQLGPIKAVRTQDIQKILEVNYRPAWDELGGKVSSFKTGLKSGAIKMNYQGGQVLLSSAWSQGDPYNRLCPTPGDVDSDECTEEHCSVGCVPLAGAQVMRYWAWPPSFDWADMPGVLTGSSSQAQMDAVALLCSNVGSFLDADYCDDDDGCATGAYFADLPGDDLRDVFEEDFGYSIAADAEERDDYSADGWFNLIKGQLDLNRPLPYVIPGHAIVVDGWQINGTKKQYHMNWGHGPAWRFGKTCWYTLDEIYGGDTDDEEVLMDLCPLGSLGNTISGTYPLNLLFPHRYFDQDATGYSATFKAGQNLRFLPGITVTCMSMTGSSIRFEGSSSGMNTQFFTKGNLSKGIHIVGDGGIKLTNNGSMIFEPVGTPWHLRCTAVSGPEISLAWQKGHGGQCVYEIERGKEGGPYGYWTQVSTSAYTDPTLYPNTTYSYRVRSVNSRGQMSEYSNEIHVRTPPH